MARAAHDIESIGVVCDGVTMASPSPLRPHRATEMKRPVMFLLDELVEPSTC
jgi:hypothetical protein